LTFLEPAQLAELAGVTEEQAEEMIAFAEQAAERVEEEGRAAREAAAQAGAQAGAEATPPARHAGDGQAGGKPTLESLFGPASDTAEEQPLSAEQVFGEESAPQADSEPKPKGDPQAE
jgi:N utilization substance protein A